MIVILRFGKTQVLALLGEVFRAVIVQTGNMFTGAIFMRMIHLEPLRKRPSFTR